MGFNRGKRLGVQNLTPSGRIDVERGEPTVIQPLRREKSVETEWAERGTKHLRVVEAPAPARVHTSWRANHIRTEKRPISVEG